MMVFAIIFLTQGCVVQTTPEQKAVLNEITLVKLLTEKQQVVRSSETFDVKSCDGSGTKQYTGCVAGTKNNFSLNLSAEAAAIAGVGYKNIAGVELQGKVQFGADFGLDFTRESNHTLELIPPPTGQVYRYTITKEYTVKTGNTSAKTASGQEITVQYNFQANCHCYDKKEVLTCEEAEKLKDLSSSTTSTTSTTTSAIISPKSIDSSLTNLSTPEKLQAAIVGRWQPAVGNSQNDNIEITNDGNLIIEGKINSFTYQMMDATHIRIKGTLANCVYNISLDGETLKLSPDSSINYLVHLYGDYVRVIPPPSAITTPSPKPVESKAKVASITPPKSEVDLKTAILGKWVGSLNTWTFTDDGKIIVEPGVDATYRIIDNEHIQWITWASNCKTKVELSGQTLDLYLCDGKTPMSFKRP